MARILIADDDEDVAIIVREHLETLGHQVWWASDGRIAWAMFEKNDYDLVILDLRMPASEGNTVCELIKKSSKKETPIIVLSAYIKEAREKMRAETYLEKPFQAGTLVDMVQQLLSKNAPRNEAKRLQDPPKN